jgi:hypothetical protein
MPRTLVTRWLAGAAVLVCAASGASCVPSQADELMLVPGSCLPSPCYINSRGSW